MLAIALLVIAERIKTMQNNTTTIPVGPGVLGRVINSQGEPIDQKGAISGAQRVPLIAPSGASGVQGAAPLPLYETGIKVIDLLAPLALGGVSALVAGIGIGKLVITEEIMHNLITRHNGFAVFIGMDETTHEASPVRDMIREIEAEEQIVMLYEQATHDVPVRQRLVRAGITIAAQFHDEGHEVVMVIDDHILGPDNLDGLHELQRIVQAKAITTIVFGTVNESDAPVETELLGALDGQIKLSKALAHEQIWPAVDPLASYSRLLDTDAISNEHQQVAEQVSQLLRRYYALRSANNAEASLSEADRQVIKRGERIRLFFTQPFYVAEAWTDIPGEYLTVEETVRSFKSLLEGRYDDLPVEAFRFTGTLDQVVAKAK
jgi:F-type H+-transporting ATPase subunit beta